MSEIKSKRVFGCAIGASVDAIGGKWKPYILGLLIHDTLRFGELHRRISANLSQKVLTQQLKELEEDGIIHRQVFAEVPPRVEYSLTPYGQSLRPVLQLLMDWGRQHLERRKAVGAVPETLSPPKQAASSPF